MFITSQQAPAESEKNSAHLSGQRITRGNICPLFFLQQLHHFLHGQEEEKPEAILESWRKPFHFPPNAI